MRMKRSKTRTFPVPPSIQVGKPNKKKTIFLTLYTANSVLGCEFVMDIRMTFGNPN